ncbi:hypothetical protein HHK36_014986 [Tetracentron sinense]|uniref:Serine aminopeptidase S33 domain-containing protein n=1 Tax=Tetracentron sinense TaxID=13715 RepID=A0A835DDF4_TETSI|nr:hypothetical protein HHK36_014986 [Tetracentron sinense]
MRIEGIDDELQKILDANMDEAPARRRAREAFKEIQLGIDHCLLKGMIINVVCLAVLQLPYDGLRMKEEPKYSYTLFAGIARKLASSGYGVFAMDYPGFGLSEGLHGYIPSFDRLVDDVIEHFSKVKENMYYQSLPSFLFGESMGGAVALKVHLKQPKAWDGAILLAPMCKIAEDLVPPWLLKQILIGVAKFFPKEKLVSQKDLAEMAFKDFKKRELTSYNVLGYKDKPRLKTAVELLRTTQEIECRLEEVYLLKMAYLGASVGTSVVGVGTLGFRKERARQETFWAYSAARGWKVLLKEGICWIIRDGKVVKFWTNNWVGDCPLMEVAIAHIQDSDLAKKVWDYTNGKGNWKCGEFTHWLPCTMLRIRAMQSFSDGSILDSVGWKCYSNEKFSTKTAYAPIDTQCLSINEKKWKTLWKYPKKHKFFLWLARQDKLLTNKTRLIRQMTNDGSCQTCISLPLLILHGEADVVTDPSVSEALYEKASSSDKKLHLYEDAYHALLEGEPDEMIFRVLDDIISWLNEHCIKNTPC